MIRLISLCLLVFGSTFTFQAKAQSEEDLALAIQYYEENKIDKAYTLFQKLSKKQQFYLDIFSQYTAILNQKEAWSDLEKFTKKVYKAYPKKIKYLVEYAWVLKNVGKEDKYKELLQSFLDDYQGNILELRAFSRALEHYNQLDWAETAYTKGNSVSPHEFDFELATIYGQTDRKDLMLTTYLDILSYDVSQLAYIQNTLQEAFLLDNEFVTLETELIKRTQSAPDKVVYNEFLEWLYIQKKKFSKALIQSKAIDKRKSMVAFNLQYFAGKQVEDLAILCMQNKDYKTAIKAYEYISKIHKKARRMHQYAQVQPKLLNAKELKIKSTYPIDTASIEALVVDYQKNISEFGMRSSNDAVRKMALLYAFYLNKKDTAATILEEYIKTPALPRPLKANAKISLGDIYILLGEPEEAMLIYYQVEKEVKETDLGHLAKLKNAKVSYYTGEFELAKSHLDILKMATTRTIANDAMELSILIQDNLELDTSYDAMNEYARIDLLVLQSKYQEAEVAYKKMLKDYPKHSLTDDIYFMLAKVYHHMRKYEAEAEYYKKILEQYATDIRGDDANFLLAELYHYHLKDLKQAQEYYYKQMTDYPSSIHVVEARKRYRKLRGDRL